MLMPSISQICSLDLVMRKAPFVQIADELNTLLLVHLRGGLTDNILSIFDKLGKQRIDIRSKMLLHGIGGILKTVVLAQHALRDAGYR